ncbi:MAG: plastocyanin/azurin family copper-binding protein [Persicimonas sp.]
MTLANNGFEPAQLTVVEGEIVQWEQEDSGTTHTVTSGTPDDPETFFSSGSLSQGDRYCLEFNQAGAFEYFCELHPQTMRGARVQVDEPR